MKTKRFVTVPREVDAIQLTNGNARVMIDWINAAGGSAEMATVGTIAASVYGVRLSTPWCTVVIRPGDWVVKYGHDTDDGVDFEAMHEVDFKTRFVEIDEADE